MGHERHWKCESEYVIMPGGAVKVATKDNASAIVALDQIEACVRENRQ